MGVSALVLALLAAPFAGGALEQWSVEVGGLVRSYVVEAPPARSGPLPVVLVLHGAGGNARQALTHYHWDRKAREVGFLAVGVEATLADPTQPENFGRNPRAWNDGSARGAQGHRGVDDVGYIRAVLDDVARRYAIDSKRLYATGFSSGASMTWRLGMEMGDRLAAIAPVAGYLPHLSRPAGPVSVLYLTGTEDPLNPLVGGTIRSPWGGAFEKPAAGHNPASWAGLLECGPPAESALQAGVTRTVWRGCAGGAEVVYVTVAGLGHHWPGGDRTALPDQVVGPYRDVIGATDLIAAFFERHHLP